MKIAIISPYISTSVRPEFYQSQQLNLAAELAKIGFEVEVITARRDRGQPPESVENGVPVIRLPAAAAGLESFFNLLVMKGLSRRLETGGYRIVQSSDDCTPSTLTAARHCLSSGAKLVLYQGLYQYSANPLKKSLMVFFDRLAGPVVRRGCSMAVCKTSRAAGYLEGKGFERVTVIPVGVNRTLFHPVDREPAERLELLAVGNLIGLKNYPLMLETLRRLADGPRDIRLTIIGSGPEKERIVGLARGYGLTDGRFRLLEGIPNSEMRRFYSQADLLLLLSDREVFGMVILEAMACGCPVLATAIPGAQDVIEDGTDGFIARGAGAGDLAAQISGILSRPEELGEVRRRAVAKVDREYGWERIAGRYAELYRSLTARAEGAPGRDARTTRNRQ